MSNARLLRSAEPAALLPWREWDRPDGLETLSNVQCFAVFVNAIIGTGVFALPYAVHHAGWLLSLAVLAVCAFFGWLTAGWTIEVCARAGAMVRAPPKAAAGRSGPEPALSLNAAAGDQRRGKTQVAALATGENGSRLMLGWERTDFSMLAQLFLGSWGQRTLLWLTAAQCYTVLWAYTSVFSSSAAAIVFEYAGLENGRCVQPLDDPSNAPDCAMVYYICVLCFAVIVVPLTLLEIEEQANVQLALTAYRFLALGVMIATLGVAMARTDNVQVTTLDPALRKKVEWAGFAGIFNAAAVAFNFQLNMPDALRPLADKAAARTVMQASFAIVVLFYIVMSLMASTVFGDNVLQPVTLNWREYNANGSFSVSVPPSINTTGDDSPQDGVGRPREWWVFAIQLVVLCFPIIDQVSVYPIVGNAMANNLTAYFAPWALEAMTDASDEKKESVAVCRWQCIEFCRCTPQYTAREKSQVKTSIRLLCAVPPIFLGAKFGSLTTIFTFAGLASFFLEFIFPAMFQRHSVQVLKDQSQAPSATQAEDGSRWWIDGARTIYSNVFSDRAFVFAALAFGSAAIAFTFLLSLLQLVAEKWLCATAPWACST